MPNNTKISEMSPAEELNTTDLLMISQQDAEVETEFHTKNTTISDLADEVVTGIQFTNDLNTDDKTIVGAINEAAAVGKVSEYYKYTNFSSDYGESGGYSYPQWEEYTVEEGHQIYYSYGDTYDCAEGESLCTFTVSGYSDVTFYIKQDGASAADTDKAYVVLGNPNTPIDIEDEEYAEIYKGDVLDGYVSHKFENLYGQTKNFQVLYHADSLSGGGTHTTHGYVYIIPGEVYTTQRGEVFNNYTSNFAINSYAHAEGDGTLATGWASHTEGNATAANGSYAHAEGDGTKAIGTESHAEGQQTIANGSASHAEGSNSIANGYNSHSEGNKTISLATGSHAEGYYTLASGSGAHAEGVGHNENERTIASGEASHAEGYCTKALGSHAHAEGLNTEAKNDDSHAEGYYTKAYTGQSHAEGYYTETWNGSGNHAEGCFSKAVGNRGAHAEGEYTQASGSNGAHSEGYYTQAIGTSAHAEGYYTEASGVGAHAEGNGYNSSTKNIASGSGSHAEGYATRATGSNSHAEGGGWGGQYNIASGTASHAEGGGNNAIGPCSHVEGTRNTVYSDSGHADGSGNTVYGHEAHGEGAGTITAGEQGHTEGAGNTNIADKGHIEGAGNRNTYNASSSHIEGAGNTNYGIQAHVEGSGNTLSGEESHVEGAGNRVHGPKSHGEGGGNVTYGLGSHIEGKHNVAVGYGQHAEGINNVIGVTEEPDYFSYGTTYAADDIVAVNDLYRDNNPYSGALEPSTPFLFKCITAPGQIQETTGVQIVTASEWNSSTTYQAGSVVKVLGVGLYTNPSESTGKHPAIKSNGWNRISAILSPFSSYTPSSKTYYLLDCDGGIYSSNVAIVDANTTVAAMWEPVTTPTGSHIEGLGNISTGDHQHVQGKFNTPDAQKAFIIGNGSVTEGTITRSNAMTVDWYGNMVLAGDVTVGAINGTISELAARIPAPPTTDGTYTLSVTVSNGVPTFSWI